MYEPDKSTDKEEKKIANRVKGIGTAAKKMSEGMHAPKMQKGAMAYDGPNKPASEAKDRVMQKSMSAKKKMKMSENRMAAYTAGGYKDDSKKQTDPSKAGFTGISGSIKDIMRQNKEIEAKNKAAKAKQGMKEQLESTGKFTAKEIESIIEKL